MPWSYLSHVRTCRLFLEANKGGGSGGGSAPTVAELAQKVTDLGGEKTKLEGDLQTVTARAEKAEADLKAEQKISEQLAVDLKAANDKASQAATDLKLEQDKSAQLTLDLTAATDKATKAEAELKTTDERTEQKLRELDARNGGTLPAKKPGAGDHTQEAAVDDKATPQDRLAAIFNAKR